jgi:8-oxo-dGTP diphosphatase
MKEYVVGLAFTRRADRLVLIRKSKPEWMAGQLNGVGGKVESGESYLDAMRREFREETGVPTLARQWQVCALKEDELARIVIFRCFSDRVLLARTMTAEPVLVQSVNDPCLVREGIKGLSELVQHARYRKNRHVFQQETSRPK